MLPRGKVCIDSLLNPLSSRCGWNFGRGPRGGRGMLCFLHVSFVEVGVWRLKCYYVTSVALLSFFLGNFFLLILSISFYMFKT